MAALAIGFLFIPLAGVLSYTAVVGVGTVKIQEPLSVTSASISPAAGTCTVTSFSFTCSVSVYAGDSGLVSVSIMNASNAPILVTPTSNSTNPDVSIVNPAPTSLPSGVSTVILFSFNVSQSAIPDSTTLHFLVNR